MSAPSKRKNTNVLVSTGWSEARNAVSLQDRQRARHESLDVKASLAGIISGQTGFSYARIFVRIEACEL